ncbi:hypothetical protein [Brevibacillus laterosporus]|uniref:hypothetical protein n=1 Tax=Brevibacillus laterosporus TaxID=1465 RepID=UPI00215C808E|nr:hypothetical protein [Brevibacillus laterosporus]MCR8994604.1 hypothetical protein [Brevibacillus laterosporus]
MSKFNSFADVVELIIKNIDMKKVEEPNFQNELLNDFKKGFMAVYGKDTVNASDCEDDDGYALIPGIIKNAIGQEFVGLLSINIHDGGELTASSTQFLTKDYGLVSLNRMKKILSEMELKLFYPFSYRLAIELEGCYKIDDDEYC